MKISTIKGAVFFLLPVLLLIQQTAKSQSAFQKLVWADEFNYKGLPDSAKWSYDKGNGCPDICGWGNNELQFYTWNRPENARVENGSLIIETKKENYSGAAYTSARLVTKNKGDWKYGRIEIKAKLPAGKGLWPAIWMLPTNWVYGGWPNSGEIDIMENVGYLPDSVFSAIHTGAYNGMKGTQRVNGQLRKDLYNAFHVYAMEWTAEEIIFLIDGVKFHSFKNERSGTQAWPFDQEFHLLLNIAVGGNWGGKHGVDDKLFPQQLQVDYVRVYQ